MEDLDNELEELKAFEYEEDEEDLAEDLENEDEEDDLEDESAKLNTEAEELEQEKTQAEIDAETIKNLEQELAVSRADFYNYRQRVAKEKQEMRRRVQDDVVIALLPVLDNLDRALMTPEDEHSRNILMGVRMVQQQFLMSLNELGVSVINIKQGDKFDHNLHEAAGTVEVDEPELDGVIMGEQLKGYKSGDKVLRAARVLVGKFNN